MARDIIQGTCPSPLARRSLADMFVRRGDRAGGPTARRAARLWTAVP